MIETLGNLGDFLGGMAVIATLIYLAAQIRQNTSTVRTSTTQQVMGNSILANSAIAAGPVPAILAKAGAGEQLSPEELAAYQFHLSGLIAAQWQVFYQHECGAIEPAIFEAFERRLPRQFGSPLAAAMWRRIAEGYPPNFQAYVERGAGVTAEPPEQGK